MKKKWVVLLIFLLALFIKPYLDMTFKGDSEILSNYTYAYDRNNPCANCTNGNHTSCVAKTTYSCGTKKCCCGKKVVEGNHTYSVAPTSDGYHVFYCNICGGETQGLSYEEHTDGVNTFYSGNWRPGTVCIICGYQSSGGTSGSSSSSTPTPTSNPPTPTPDPTPTTTTLTVNPNGEVWNDSTSSQTFTGTTGSTKSLSNPTVSVSAISVSYNGNGGSVSGGTTTAHKTFSHWMHSGGGSLSGSTYTYGSSDGMAIAIYSNGTVTLANASRDGYTFDGWYTASSGGTYVGGAGSSYSPSNSITLYAHWTTVPQGTGTSTLTVITGAVSNTYTQAVGTTKTISNNLTKPGYTVTFDGNGGTPAVSSLSNYLIGSYTLTGGGSYNGSTYTFGTNDGTLTAFYGSRSSIVLPDAYRSGYELVGWYESNPSNASNARPGRAISPSENYTLHACWIENSNPESTPGGTTPTSYTLTVNPNGGTWSGSSSTQTFTGYTGNTKTGLTAPTKSGSCTVTLNVNGGNSISPSSYTSSYVGSWSRSGGGSLSGTTYTYGSSDGTFTGYYEYNTVTLPTPTRSNYKFVGWYTAAEGGTSVSNPYRPTGNITLYARWTPNSVSTSTLTVNPNGGTWNGSTASNTYTQQVNSTMTIANPTISNYVVTFNENGGRIIGDNVGEVNRRFLNWTNTGYKGLNGTTYTFGSTNGTITANYSDGTITLPEATRSGYILTGWYTASSGGTKFGNAGVSYPVTSNLTLYAQWTAGTSSLVVNPNGGTWRGSKEAQTIYGTYDTSVTIEDPVPPNGYGVTFDAMGGSCVDSYKVQNVTFKTWQKNGSGFMGSGYYIYGSSSGSITAVYNRYAVILPDASYAGKKLVGWYTTPTYENKVGDAGEAYVPTSTTTLYAKWSDNLLIANVDGPNPNIIGKNGVITYQITLTDPTATIDKSKIYVTPFDSSVSITEYTYGYGYSTTPSGVQVVVNVSDIDPGTGNVTVTITNNNTLVEGKYALVIGSGAFTSGGISTNQEVCSPFLVNTTLKGSIRYSTTSPTKGSIVATFVPNYEIYEGLKTIWLSGQTGFSHIFTENGTYTFQAVDSLGNTANFTATVDWIVKNRSAVSMDYDVLVGGTIFPKVMIKTNKSFRLNQSKPVEFTIKNGSGTDVTNSASVTVLSIREYYGDTEITDLSTTFPPGTYLLTVAVGKVFTVPSTTYTVSLSKVNIINATTAEAIEIEGLNSIRATTYALLNLD